MELRLEDDGLGCHTTVGGNNIEITVAAYSGCKYHISLATHAFGGKKYILS